MMINIILLIFHKPINTKVTARTRTLPQALDAEVLRLLNRKARQQEKQTGCH